MPQLIPTFSLPLYTMRVPLEGSVYVFNWDYNGREDRIYLSLALPEGETLISGVKIVPGIGLLSRLEHLQRPAGELLCVSPSRDLSAPGLGELGEDKRCKLYYYSAAEMDALLAEVL